MYQLNNVLLEGVVATTPEVVATNSVTKSRLVKFVLANDRFYRDLTGAPKQETLFIPVQCWGDLGEQCLTTMKKGMQTRCVGRLMLCRWQSKQGQQRSTIEVVCNHLEVRVPFGSLDRGGGVEILEDRKKEAETLSETVVLYEF
ncbi:MAG: single-stranded DNA-binding protein [Spirochaetales bacterium]|nr:single-stranded DNA-binding protein [Candidatus Physcosoma equi]